MFPRATAQSWRATIHPPCPLMPEEEGLLLPRAALTMDPTPEQEEEGGGISPRPIIEEGEAEGEATAGPRLSSPCFQGPQEGSVSRACPLFHLDGGMVLLGLMQTTTAMGEGSTGV